jgi:hypothetical protein
MRRGELGGTMRRARPAGTMRHAGFAVAAMVGKA